MASKTQILIVDDNEAWASALEECIEEAGLQCSTLTDSPQALATLHRREYGVGLFDLHMPGLGGLDLLRNAKSIDEDMQIALMTASDDLESAVAALKLGAFDYVCKEKPVEEIVAVVRKAVYRHEEAVCERTRLDAMKEEVRLRTVELEAGNARLRDLLLNVIRSMALALEARDPYTKGHGERVAVHSMAIAERLLLPPDQIKHIQFAGLLHDIGKIGIREDVLQKTGKLTDEEYAEIRKHPTVGANILQPISQFEDIIECVLHHHQRLDGSGYPDNLSGSQIPFGAKILAVADAFDAMTSDRSYRPAMSMQEAMKELNRCSGSQFEPVIVDAFSETVRTMGPAPPSLRALDQYDTAWIPTQT